MARARAQRPLQAFSTLTLRVCAAQVLEQKARDKRLKKRELKIKLNWILRKKARGF